MKRPGVLKGLFWKEQGLIFKNINIKRQELTLAVKLLADNSLLKKNADRKSPNVNRYTQAENGKIFFPWAIQYYCCEIKTARSSPCKHAFNRKEIVHKIPALTPSQGTTEH